MKKYSSIRIWMVFILTSMLAISCVEDGEPGPAGPEGDAGSRGIGVNGTNGSPGTDGDNGLDGIGFEQADDLGSMTLTVSGNGPDGDTPFEHVKEFKYASANFDLSSWSEQPNEYYFNLKRFTGIPDSYLTEFVSYSFTVDISGEPVVVSNSLGLEITIVLSNSPPRALVLSLDEYSFDDEMTNFSFDPLTGTLQFEFETVLVDDNTNYGDVTINCKVNVLTKKSRS